VAVDEERPGVGRSSRLTALLDLLAEEGRLSVGHAAQVLDVSEATVRRDFNSLAEQQLVTRTHGGVVAASLAYGLPVRYRGNDDAKERIADTAAALVRPGEVVGFNGGTTTSATARRVAARADLAQTGTDPGLTVVTNALNIATEMVLRPHIRTVSLGGIARPNSYELVGPLATLVLRELWLDHLFLGVDGFTSEGGASCFQEGEAAVSSTMVERATRVTVVAGGEKLGRRTFSRICDSASVSSLVTDSSADERELARIRALGVEVHVA
jgi:DeoR family transcriptional regulator of aga operon